MIGWQEKTNVTTTYVAVVADGFHLRLIKTKGTCKDPDCVKWQVFCPPFISQPQALEVTEDDIEQAKFAAIQLVRAHVAKILNVLGEMK